MTMSVPTSLPVADAAYPTPDQMRDTVLRAIRYVYLRINIDRNVLPGSDDYLRIDKAAQRWGIAIANNQISAANSDPLTSQDIVGGTQALTNLAAAFGVFARPAASSAGDAVVSFVGTFLTLPSSPAWTGTLADGHKITAAPGTYAQGTLVPVTADDSGASTNELAGAIITWDSAAIGALAPTATVATGGMVGGADADDQETLRQRLLRRLTAAAVGGNWSSVVGWVEASTASVGTGYCFSACQGAASYDICIVAIGGNRTLPPSIVALVKAYVAGQMPGQQQLTCTTVTPVGVDISLQAKIPLPQSAGGKGGGWRDGQPYPQGEDVKVTGYNPTTGIATFHGTVNTPVPGNSIGVWNPAYVDPLTGAVGQMVEYTIASVAGTSGAWLVTVQNGFSFSPLGAYVSAGAYSLVAYAATFAAAVAVLGPGQKTTLPELLPLAARQPDTDTQAPSDLTTTLLDELQTPYPEIADLQWGVHYLTGTTTSVITPPIPTSTANPPNIFTLSNFAFRRE
jgi:hypothetical protein